MKKTLIWIVVIVLVLFGIYFFISNSKKATNNLVDNNVASSTIVDNQNNNTNNAYIIPNNWVATSSNGLTFKYPTDLGTKYISLANWPPVINVTENAFACNETGKSEIGRGGITTFEKIIDRDYCVTKESEGAAGSTYTTYKYAFSYKNKTAILTFTLRFPQCMNYDDPKQTECKTEESLFDIGPTVSMIRSQIEANQ